MSAAIMAKEALEALDKTRAEMTEMWQKKGEDGRPDLGGEAGRERFRTLNEVSLKQAEEYKTWKQAAAEEAEQKALIDEARRPTSPAPFSTGKQDNRERQAERKSIGEMAIESQSYKRFVDSSQSGYARLDLPEYGVTDFKTTMTTSAGYAPFVTRGPEIVPYAIRRPMIQDLMPSFPIREKGIEYMEETTRTANAAPVAEAATKPESARAFTARTANAEVIATTLPVTEQQLDDAPFLMAYINQTLGEEIKLAEEDALLSGNGTPPQIQGFLSKSGVQTQPKGSDPVISAVMKAITLVRWTGFADPNAIVAHPNDWQDVLLLQDADGRYIFGDPSALTGLRGLWGVTAVVTPAMTENTMLVGDFARYSYIIRRQGLRIDIGLVNDQFLKNAKTIRAETRMGLAITRGAAFCKVTGV